MKKEEEKDKFNSFIYLVSGNELIQNEQLLPLAPNKRALSPVNLLVN